MISGTCWLGNIRNIDGRKSLDLMMFKMKTNIHWVAKDRIQRVGLLDRSRSQCSWKAMLCNGQFFMTLISGPCAAQNIGS